MHFLVMSVGRALRFSTADYDLTVGLWGCALICVGPRECYPNVGFYSVAMSLLRNMSIFDC